MIEFVLCLILMMVYSFMVFHFAVMATRKKIGEEGVEKGYMMFFAGRYEWKDDIKIEKGVSDGAARSAGG